jgi:hypothetical protein
MNIEQTLSTAREAVAVVTAGAASGPELATSALVEQVQETRAALQSDDADCAEDDDLPLSDSGPETALCW